MKKILFSAVFWLILLMTTASIVIALINPSFTVSVNAEHVNRVVRTALPMKTESLSSTFTLEDGATFNFQNDGKIGINAPFSIKPRLFRETHYKGVFVGSAKIRFSENTFFLDELADIEIQGSVVKSKRAAAVENILRRGKDSLGIPQEDLDAIIEFDKLSKAAKDVISSKFSSIPLYTLQEKWWHRIVGIMITEIGVDENSITATIRPREVSLAYLSILGIIITIAMIALAVRITKLPVTAAVYALFFFWI